VRPAMSIVSPTLNRTSNKTRKGNAYHRLPCARIRIDPALPVGLHLGAGQDLHEILVGVVPGVLHAPRRDRGVADVGEECEEGRFGYGERVGVGIEDFNLQGWCRNVSDGVGLKIGLGQRAKM
jgi:hypothetical protein